MFRIYPKYSDRQTWANSVDSGQTSQTWSGVCSESTVFAHVEQFLDISTRNKIELLKLKENYDKK